MISFFRNLYEEGSFFLYFRILYKEGSFFRLGKCSYTRLKALTRL